jgi:hypothetical protein
MDERAQPAADQWTEPIWRTQRIDIRREVEKFLWRSAGLHGQLSHISAVFIISMIHRDRLFGLSKKIPSLRIEDWGFHPLAPFTALSSKTFYEEYPGRFSDSPALSAAFPSLDTLLTVAINLLKGFPFSFQKRAGLQRRARPRLLPSRWESRGSLHPDIIVNKTFLTNCRKVCQVVIWISEKVNR